MILTFNYLGGCVSFVRIHHSSSSSCTPSAKLFIDLSSVNDIYIHIYIYKFIIWPAVLQCTAAAANLSGHPLGRLFDSRTISRGTKRHHVYGLWLYAAKPLCVRDRDLHFSLTREWGILICAGMGLSRIPPKSARLLATASTVVGYIRCLRTPHNKCEPVSFVVGFSAEL